MDKFTEWWMPHCQGHATEEETALAKLAFEAGIDASDKLPHQVMFAEGVAKGHFAAVDEISNLKAELDLYKKAGHIQIWKDQKERIAELETFVKNIHDNYDCDSDQHKYNNGVGCRCCDAKKLFGYAFGQIGENCGNNSYYG